MGNSNALQKVRFAFSDELEETSSLHDIKEWIRAERDKIMSCTHADNTVRSYRSMWNVFNKFCEMFDYEPLPASFDTIADFLCIYGQDRTWASARNAYSAIRYHHLIAGHPCHYPIEIKRLLNGLRRRRGKPAGRKKAILTDVVTKICADLDARGGIKAVRDKAMLLAAYGGALRASEVVGRDAEHLTFSHAGVVIFIPRSKTDQAGEGQEVSIPRLANPERCPVVALEEWLDVLARLRGSRSGPLFPVLRAAGDKAIREVRLVNRRMTTNDYRNVLKDLCDGVGENPSEIGGHSLRAGHATQAAENGASPFEIAAQGRWSSLQMVLVYVRMGKRFQNNSASHLGL